MAIRNIDVEALEKRRGLTTLEYDLIQEVKRLRRENERSTAPYPKPITMTERELEEIASKDDGYDEHDAKLLRSSPHFRDLVHSDPKIRKEAVKKHLRSLFKIVPDKA